MLKTAEKGHGQTGESKYEKNTVVYRLLLRLLLTCKEVVAAGVVFDWLLGSNKMIYGHGLLGFMSHKKRQRKNRLLLAYPSSVFFTQLLTWNKKCDFFPCFYPAFSPDFLGAMKDFELLKLLFSLLFFFLFYCFFGMDLFLLSLVSFSIRSISF